MKKIARFLLKHSGLLFRMLIVLVLLAICIEGFARMGGAGGGSSSNSGGSGGMFSMLFYFILFLKLFLFLLISF
ncbi:MAG: hypothetical protein GX793_08410 [Bacteroidales bacterium]|nr:hypothetical protein [Bacteroidales bacterium]